MKKYEWGTGYFRDIADIRRRVYTDYYTMVELFDTLKEILTIDPTQHCLELFMDIESPKFDINSKKYEEIKSYLWEKSKEKFGIEIALWEKKKNEIVKQQSKELLPYFSNFLGELDMGSDQDWKKAVLFASSLNLFDILKEKDTEEVINEIRQMLLKANTPFGINLSIDFSDLFMKKIVNNPQKTVIFAGDINTLFADLKLYGEELLNTWIKKIMKENETTDLNKAIDLAKKMGISITFIVNEYFSPRNNNKIIQRNATLENVLSLFSFKDFERLNLFKEGGLFKICAFSSKFSGTVLTDLNDNAKRYIEESNSVIALGEQNNITVDGLEKDCFRIFPIRDFASIFYTGIKYDKERFMYPCFSILFAPSKIFPAIDYVPDVPTKLSAKQYYAIYNAIPISAWESLINEAQRANKINLLDVASVSDSLSSGQKKLIQENAGLSGNEAMEIAKEKMRELGGTFAHIEDDAGKGRLKNMNIIHFPQGKNLELNILFSKEIKNFKNGSKSKITFEDVIQNADEAFLGFNFLYFITRNIILKFNKANPHFLLGDCFFGEFIGFLKTNLNGKKIMYPPLYNKGAIGVNEDGTFVFDRIKMPSKGTIILPIEKEEVVFEWTCINPLEDFDDKISIFTPMEEQFKDEKRQAPNFFGKKKCMHFLPDNENYNFVMINDNLLGVVKGSTEIPPFGTVLSVPSAFFNSAQKAILDERCNKINIEKEKVERLLKVSFNINLDKKWDKCKRIMGGALLMVDNGKIENLIYDPNSTNSVYDLEGWALDSSQRTQETPVEANLNEARTTAGLTDDNEFFIVTIDGRANNRTGATHEETVKWIQDYFETKGKKIKYALDLDSASSVALGIFIKGKFYLLNQTARGSDSKICDTRYYNHIAYLSKKANKSIEKLNGTIITAVTGGIFLIDS